MKHKHINRKQCLLYHLDELSEKEKNRLIKRIGSCDQCQQRLRDEEILIQNIYQFPLLTPAKAYRDKIRNLLLSSLKKITHRSDKQITRTIQGIVPILHYPKIQWAAAVAILILGIVIGHFGLPMKNNTIPFAQEFEALSPDSMPVTNIQVVSSYTEGNQFEMHFQTVQDFHIKGHINDPRLQYALAYLLMNSPKDNIRLKAIELLSQVSKHESVQLALIHALEYDVNPGIRLKAIKVLNQLPLNPSFKDIFIRAFIKDTNSGVRIETAEALSRCQDPDIVSVLQNEAQNDDFIKALVLKTQRQINQKETKQL